MDLLCRGWFLFWVGLWSSCCIDCEEITSSGRMAKLLTKHKALPLRPVFLIVFPFPVCWFPVLPVGHRQNFSFRISFSGRDSLVEVSWEIRKKIGITINCTWFRVRFFIPTILIVHDQLSFSILSVFVSVRIISFSRHSLELFALAVNFSLLFAFFVINLTLVLLRLHLKSLNFLCFHQRYCCQYR